MRRYLIRKPLGRTGKIGGKVKKRFVSIFFQSSGSKILVKPNLS